MSRVLFEERQRVPWWVYPALFALVMAVGGSGVLIAYLLYGSNGSGVWIGLGVMTGIALEAPLAALLSRKLIRLYPDRLEIGRGRTIPLDQIVSARIVHGREIKQIRSRMMALGAGTSGLALAPLGPLALDAGMISGGFAMIATKDRRRGMACSPWQHPALLIETPHLRTKLWLVATRRPRHFVGALDAACSAAANAAEPLNPI